MIRSLTISAVLCVTTVALGSGPAFAANNSVPVAIVDIGDSLITGYELPHASQFRTLLEQRLKDAGYDVTVADTGFQETSKSGVSWLPRALAPVGGVEALSRPNTVVILELGSNDCPEGLDLDATKANLDQMLVLLSAKQIPVLIVGTGAYESCGADYAAAFAQIFTDLANKFGSLLYPEFKAGVLGHQELFQEDHDHPNAAGEVVIVQKILPIVEALIVRLDH